jgi:predicted  nucleic acid-binding Zn-ribbon protein
LTISPLDALVALQDIDTAIDQHRHQRSHLPERTELAAIDHQAAGLRSAAAEVTQIRDRIAERQAVLEADLSATEERSAAVSRRLYGGEVSASRELQALAADIDGLKARASVLEDQVLEVMEEREPLDTRLGGLSSEIAALEQRQGGLAAALAASEAAIDQQLGDLAYRRQAAARAVPADLAATYDRLRARLGGIAVARLVGSHCDGCHLTLPAAELDRIRHLPDGEVVTCDQCGRILVRA